MNANMIAPHCLTEVMEADLGFRTSSPSHENGFVWANQCFVVSRVVKQVHEAAIGGSDD